MKKLHLLFIPLLLAISSCSGTPLENEGENKKNANSYPLISFITNGGTSIDPIEYKGSPISLPITKYYHHDFLGWWENPTFSGEAVNADNYSTSQDVTLYANWDEVTYVYMYYGQEGEYYNVYSFHPGDVVNLKNTFTPPTLQKNGFTAPFVKWTYEENSNYVYEDAPAQVTIGTEDLYFVAQYDLSLYPPVMVNLNEYEPGRYVVTNYRQVAYPFYPDADGIGSISADINVKKGHEGGAGVTARMRLSGKNFPYEDFGTGYYAAVYVPASGTVQVSRLIASGDSSGWSLLSTIAAASLPSATQAKYNNAPDGGGISINMKIVTHLTELKVYIDGTLIYTVETTNTEKMSTPYNMTGTCFGIRCSSRRATFENIRYEDGKDIYVNFANKQGVKTVKWVCGAIPAYSTPNYVSNGYYFDSGLTSQINENNASSLKAGDTVYAKCGNMFTHSGLSKSGNTYNTSAQCVALIGTGSKKNCTITMNINFKKGSGGASGIILGANIQTNNSWEASAKYLMAQITTTGALQVARNDGLYTIGNNATFGHILVDGSKSFNDMPNAFKTAFNNTATGSTFAVTLIVTRDNNTVSVKVRCGTDEKVMCTTNQTDVVSLFDDFGYGVRINGAQVGNAFTYSYQEN